MLGRLAAFALVAAVASGAVAGRGGSPAAAASAPAVVGAERAHAESAALAPSIVAALEARGLSFGEVIGADGVHLDALAKSEAYGSIVRAVGAEIAAANRRAGVAPATEVGAAPNHGFDPSWLVDPRAHFALAGVTNRMDRRFAVDAAHAAGGHAGAAPTCGEVRFVYRLALAPAGRPETRLPMTVALVADQTGTCDEVARRWTALPSGGEARVAALAAMLLPAASATARAEVNLQELHGPAMRADEDDHAEYLMMAFRRSGEREREGDGARGAFDVAPLTNTPRADLDADGRRAVARWITENFAAIDAGTAVLPEALAATRAVSVSPRGLARTANRPFAALIDRAATDDPIARAIDALPYESAAMARSRAALLRRLDEGTCQGCHQSRAIAGFHLLGEERDPDARMGALAAGVSAHFEGELAWRDRLVQAAARRGEGAFAEPRPFAERTTGGEIGAHCGLGDPGFAAWTCAPGLACKATVNDAYAATPEVGACAPVGANGAGDACQRVKIEPEAGPDGDHVVPRPADRCVVGGDAGATGAAACIPNATGFPGGMCTAPCAREGEIHGDTVCGGVPESGFESVCLAAPTPIEACVAAHRTLVALRRCDAVHACRDDYACARIPGAPADVGGCVPPYFVFQARVDGPVLDR